MEADIVLLAQRQNWVLPGIDKDKEHVQTDEDNMEGQMKRRTDEEKDR